MLLPPQVITRPTLQLDMRDSGCLCGLMLCLNMTYLYGKYVFICQGSLCGMAATHLLLLLLLLQHHVLQERNQTLHHHLSLAATSKSEGTLHHQGCSCTQNRTRSAVAHIDPYLLDGLERGDCGERRRGHLADVHVHVAAVLADGQRRVFLRHVLRLLDILGGLLDVRLAIDRVAHGIQVVAGRPFKPGGGDAASRSLVLVVLVLGVVVSGVLASFSPFRSTSSRAARQIHLPRRERLAEPSCCRASLLY